MDCRNMSNLELRELNGPLNMEREELKMTPQARFLAWVPGWIAVPLPEIGNKGGGGGLGGDGREDKLWVF